MLTEPIIHSMTDPYSVLGVDRAATLDEIKSAYFAQVRQHPPEQDQEAFKRIRAAYDQLRDPQRRIEADMRLIEEWPVPTRSPRLPKLDLGVQTEDVLSICRSDTDLARQDFRSAFRRVQL